MQTPVQKHDWVAKYNWDDGIDLIWPIVDDEKTEFATALMIYWRLGGPWFEGSVSGGHKRLYDTVTRRLTNGFYTNRQIRYYPIEDSQLSRTQVFKLHKNGLPREVIEPNYSDSTRNWK